MCKLYSNDSKMYLAHIKIPTARTDTNGYYRFYVIDGYRKLKKHGRKTQPLFWNNKIKNKLSLSTVSLHLSMTLESSGFLNKMTSYF